MTVPATVRFPVDGLKDNFVDDTFWGRFPLVVVTQVGYMVALVVVSFVIAVFVALVAVPAVATLKLATGVVEATTKGAVPVARVLVNWPDMPIVVTEASAPEDSVTVPHAPVPDEPLFLSI